MFIYSNTIHHLNASFYAHLIFLKVDEDAEENTYIGKSRYKHNEYAVEEDLTINPRSAKMHELGRNAEKITVSGEEMKKRDKIQRNLDRQQAEKHNASHIGKYFTNYILMNRFALPTCHYILSGNHG